MRSKQTVLMVHNFYQIPGGEDTVVANEKRLLEEHGHKVVLYTRHNNELKEMSKLQKLTVPFTTIFNPRTYREVKRIILEENIDIIHVHNTFNRISPAVYYAARKCRIPVVQTVHNFRLLCPGATFYRDGHICEDCVSKGLWCAIKHACYRGSKAQTFICVISTKIHRWIGIYGKINYICLTEFNREKLIQLKQIKPERVFVKPNFTFDSDNSTGGTGRYYLFVGRLETIKGIKLVLQAFTKMPEYEIHIAGSGRENFTENYGENIVFLGQLEWKELINEYKNAKALIMASQVYEGFPMAIVEAYANGVPVITGNLGNCGVLVDDGRTGFQYQYDSCIDLMNAVKKFEKTNINRLHLSAKRYFENFFAPRPNYDFIRHIYDSINVR